MAHPFIILGGIVITVATATFGAIQMPGWVDGAENASATAEVQNIAAAQSLAVNDHRAYLAPAELADYAEANGFILGATEMSCLAIAPAGNAYAAVVPADSGAYFAIVASPTTSAGKVGQGVDAPSALVAAGGLPTGVANPVDGGQCALGASLVG